jgi:transcriptional coactivator HFI1/ADA1
LHNQFLAGIYSNSLRDPPETEIATFVSAHDKPTTASGKQVVGDAAEQRLKSEIMALPPRERHRLKQLADQGYGGDEFQRMMREVKDSWAIRPPDVVPPSAGGFNKTNWELEIGKRFELPLFSESNEFPDADMIQKRMVPLCYQEGLAGGCNNGCSDLVNIAAEMFVKQLLTESFRRVRSNGVKYIQTHAFRRKLEREEGQLQRGQIKRDSFGLLPCEQEVERNRPPFGVEDLRFALGLGNSYMAQNKLLTAKIFNRPLQRQENRKLESKNKSAVNGMVNGVNGQYSPVKMERTALDDVLDEVLDGF